MEHLPHVLFRFSNHARATLSNGPEVIEADMPLIPQAPGQIRSGWIEIEVNDRFVQHEEFESDGRGGVDAHGRVADEACVNIEILVLRSVPAFVPENGGKDDVRVFLPGHRLQFLGGAFGVVANHQLRLEFDRHLAQEPDHEFHVTVFLEKVIPNAGGVKYEWSLDVETNAPAKLLSR